MRIRYGLSFSRVVLAFTGLFVLASTGCAQGRTLPDPQATAASTALGPFVTDGTMARQDWTLVEAYSDDFNQKGIARDKWNTEPRSWGRTWSWSGANASLADGNLRLKMMYSPHKVHRRKQYYTSGILESRKPVLYGYFEARIKGSYPQPGTCPAFWLGGHKVLQYEDNWTEIDILEAGRYAQTVKHVFRPYYVTHKVRVFQHPDAPTLSPQGRREWMHDVGGGLVSWDPSAQYHVYGLEWTPRVIRTYVDGELQGTISNRWWHKPLLVILSLGLRKPYMEEPSPEGFPAVMSVDYIRVWKSSNLDALPPLQPAGPVSNRGQWKNSLKVRRQAPPLPGNQRRSGAVLFLIW